MSRKAEKIAFQTLADSGMKKSVRLAWGGNISTLAGVPMIDGVQTKEDDRILLFGQTDASENGIYQILFEDPSRKWERVPDMERDSHIEHNTLVQVEEGNTYADSMFILVSDGDLEVGVSDLEFKPISFSSYGGDGNLLMQVDGSLTPVARASYESNTVSATDTFTLSNTPIEEAGIACYVDDGSHTLPLAARIEVLSVSGNDVTIATPLSGSEDAIFFDYFYKV